MTCVSVGRGLAFGGDTFFSQVLHELYWKPTTCIQLIIHYSSFHLCLLTWLLVDQ